MASCSGGIAAASRNSARLKVWFHRPVMAATPITTNTGPANKVGGAAESGTARRNPRRFGLSSCTPKRDLVAIWGRYQSSWGHASRLRHASSCQPGGRQRWRDTLTICSPARLKLLATEMLCVDRLGRFIRRNCGWALASGSGVGAGVACGNGPAVRLNQHRSSHD